MAGTLFDMKVRIANEISRSDLLVEIGDAINDAIAAYQSTRFRFSETVPGAPPTFNTAQGQWVYTSADNANISTMQSIDYVLMNIANSVQYLDRVTPEEIKLYNQQNTMAGQPMWFAYEGNELIISPVPDKAYLLTLGISMRVPGPATDDVVGNPWMTDAELLIRSRAKFELATHILKDAALAAAMSPDPGSGGATYRAWCSLKAEANEITGTGRIRAMRF